MNLTQHDTFPAVLNGKDSPAAQGRSVRMKIDPARAQQLLRFNEGNRPCSRVFVEKYSAMMKADRWHFNPADAIVVSDDGRLINGQHRLQAVILSDTEQEFMVYFDAEADAFLLMDRPNPRSGGDYLAMQDVKHPLVVAAALKWIVNEERAREKAAASGSCRIYQWAIEPDETRDAFKRHPNIVKSARNWTKLTTPRRMFQPAIATWLHYRFSEIDPIHADYYFEKLSFGEDCSRGMPEFTVRTWLCNALSSVHRPVPETVAAIIVKGWNASIRGREMLVARWVSSEGFPKILGSK